MNPWVGLAAAVVLINDPDARAAALRGLAHGRYSNKLCC